MDEPVVRKTDLFLLPNESLTDKELWFRSMFCCPRCRYDGVKFALCGFHQEGKEMFFERH